MRDPAVSSLWGTLPRRSVFGLAAAALAILSLALAAQTASALVEFNATHYDAGTSPQAVAVGDLNGDGTPDVVVADSGGGAVSVLLGKGDGAFAAATSFPVGASPIAVALGDFNKDGKLDIVTADSGADTVSVLLGKGDGTFAASAAFATGGGPKSVAVGDVDRDGKLDVVSANATDGTVSVLRGDGAGGLAAHQDAGRGRRAALRRRR